MCALRVAPLVPVAKEKTFGDVGLYFAFIRRFVLSFVAVVILAFGINFGRECDPAAVRRPDRTTGAGRNPGYLCLVAALVIHGPDLASRDESYLFPIWRPAWSRGGF